MAPTQHDVEAGELTELKPTTFVMDEVATHGEGGGGGASEGMMGMAMKTLMPQCSELTIKRLFLVSMIGQLIASIVGFACLLLNGWPVLLIPVLGYTIQVFTRSLALYNLLFQAFFAFLGLWAFLGNKDKETKAKIIDDKGLNMYLMISGVDFIVCSIAIVIMGPFLLFPIIVLTMIMAGFFTMWTLFVVLGWAFSLLCWPCGAFVVFFGYCIAAVIAFCVWCIGVFLFWAQIMIPFTWAGVAVVFIVFDILHFLLFAIVHLVGVIAVVLGAMGAMKYHKKQGEGSAVAPEETS